MHHPAQQIWDFSTVTLISKNLTEINPPQLQHGVVTRLEQQARCGKGDMDVLCSGEEPELDWDMLSFDEDTLIDLLPCLSLDRALAFAS